MLGGKPTFQECDWLFWDWIHSALDYKNQYVVSLLGTVLVFAFLSEWGGCSLAPASFILQHNFKDITSQGSPEGGIMMYHYSEYHIYPIWGEVKRFMFHCET